MGNSLEKVFAEWGKDQCAESANLSGGLKKCYFDRGFSAMSFILFWVIFYQIFFIYHKCYNVPIFQIGKRQAYRERELRQDILVVCATTSFYTTIHYLMPRSYRAGMVSFIAVLRFNIMIMLTFYYLKMASEQIFSRIQYLRFKWTLLFTYAIFMSLMLFSSIAVYVQLDAGTYRPDQLCISWNFLSLRWGEIFCSMVFLIITVFVQIRVEDEFKKKLLKVNFE